jgi:3-dehydroquinate synthase
VGCGPISVEDIASAFQLDHIVVLADRKVAQLHDHLAPLLSNHPTVFVDATEDAKELGAVREMADAIIDAGLTRRHTILAVGGGITQDIASFCASVIYRGVGWAFLPTSLLAQADSCIGSKTSINLLDRKNALGTFHAPQFVRIDPRFLSTLTDLDVRSGIGEMLKVHAIAGPAIFDSFAGVCSTLHEDSGLMADAIYESLKIKRAVIEADEFDSGTRLVMNYGHTFGHAIELATSFRIPHGIAITMGCDVANFVAWQLGISTAEHYERMHSALALNYEGSADSLIDMDIYAQALRADKKHRPDRMIFVLPDNKGTIGVHEVEKQSPIVAISAEYLMSLSGQ